MGLDDLAGCIKLLQERIRAYEATLRKDETRTRMALIDPLLTALGWDVNDPGLVRPEYKVVDGKADYALLRTEDSPAAIIEAKRLGTVLDDKIRHQMLTYATFVGIKYAGVTDGDHWELYEVLRAGPLEERQALKVSIAADPAYASALRLLRLWRPNLTSGDLVRANEPIFVDPPSPPDGPDEELEVDSPPNNWVPLPEYAPPPGTPCPSAIRFWDGSERPLEKWNQLLTSVVEKLYEEGRFTAKNRTIGWSKKFYCVHTEPVHPTGKKFGNIKSIADGALFVEGGLSAAKARLNAKQVLKHFDQDPAEVYLQAAQ